MADFGMTPIHAFTTKEATLRLSNRFDYKKIKFRFKSLQTCKLVSISITTITALSSGCPVCGTKSCIGCMRARLAVFAFNTLTSDHCALSIQFVNHDSPVSYKKYYTVSAKRIWIVNSFVLRNVIHLCVSVIVLIALFFK